jgi:hypothetical protein
MLKHFDVQSEVVMQSAWFHCIGWINNLRLGHCGAYKKISAKLRSGRMPLCQEYALVDALIERNNLTGHDIEKKILD